jgi:hypothetical protein
MRFKIKINKEPQIGDKRVHRWFALVPVCIEREVRWLEWVTVKQELVPTKKGEMIGNGEAVVYYENHPGRWANKRFIDADVEKQSERV